MSRIGRLSIPVPVGVEVALAGDSITVSGPKGTLARRLVPELRVVQEDGRLRVERPGDDKRSRELHGLTRTLVANMVTGVTTGFRKGLEITGVGYRAQKVGEKLQLNLGYSHPIEIEPPAGISFEVENPTRPGTRGGARRPGPRPPPGPRRPPSAMPGSASRSRGRPLGRAWPSSAA